MAESFTGQVQNGVIIPDKGTAPLPEGARFRFEVIPLPEDDRVAGTRRLLTGWARRSEAVAPPLPSDLAEEHDHYAHGKPRP